MAGREKISKWRYPALGGEIRRRDGGGFDEREVPILRERSSLKPHRRGVNFL